MRARRVVPVSVIVCAALVAPALGAFALPASAASAPVPLVLSVVGDGTSALSTAVAPVSIATIASDGSAISTPSVSLPVAADGDQLPFTLSGSSSAIGQLALAGDAKSLAIVGYSSPPAGSTGAYVGDPKDSTAAAVPRIVAAIEADGTTDTSTVLTGAFSVDHARSVATQDGQSFYVSGNGQDKTPAAGVVLAQRGSDAAPVAITASPLNSRNLAISGGKLYSSASGGTERGIWAVGGSPLPTTSTGITSTRVITAASGTPASFLMLDRDSTPGADTAYINVEGDGLYKWALNGSAWVAQGKLAGTFQAVTGRVVDGGAELYLIKATSAANTVVAITDTAAPTATFAPTADVTIATAAANTAYRGIALAPTDWAPEGDDVPAPVESPTAEVTPTAATTVVGSSALTTTLALGDEGDADPATFTVEATASSNTAVAATADVVITGTGDSRTVSVTPVGVGITAITLTVTNPANDETATAQFTVGASGATPNLTTVKYHTGSADASTAIALDDEYMLVADDETNVIRLYSRTTDGPAIKEFDLSTSIGTKEVDLEASARVGDTIYWVASHGNNKDSEYKEARSVFFTTQVSGSGATTQLTYGGSYTGLRKDLLAWDAANSNRLGLGAACTLDGGTHPDQTTGCNIEGFEFAANKTTGLIGFRSPRVEGKALVVPVTNATALAGASATATFGDPILLDLGGRTIREIRGNGAGEYLITAGTPDDVDQTLGWALYRWNGLATGTPVKVATLPSESGAAGQASGSYESIVEVPAVIRNGAPIQLLTDNGTTVFYADGVEGKDVAPAQLLKFRSNVVTIAGPAVTAATPTISGLRIVGNTLTAVTGTWTPSSTTFGYQWTRDGEKIVGATASVYTLTAADVSTAIAVTVTGTASGFESATLTSAATVAISAGVIDPATPRITGSALVGKTLSATVGLWTPHNVSRAFQWTRNGTPITGATAASYTLVKADAGTDVAVTVTGTLEGYTSASGTGASVAVLGVLTTTPTPKITGTAKVGKKLTASAGSWKPSPVALRYQWSRSGVAIKGATAKTYVTKSADKGKKLTVTVTGSKTSYLTVAKKSAAKKIK